MTEARREARARDLSPRKVVAELDRHVVGQSRAKRAVAIALRDRWRRQRLEPALAREVTPKNILMIGPTGVGKTEIARRLARLTDAPFLKVEASKFTEVGYVGRDVESIARDLVEAAMRMVRDERRARVAVRAAAAADEKLVDLLVTALAQDPVSPAHDGRDRVRRELKEGKHEAREVEIEVADDRMSQISVMTPQGVEEMGIDLPSVLPNLFGGPKKKRVKLPVTEARPLLVEREADALADEATIPQEAIHRVEETGIVFLDEIDKIASRDGAGRGGPDVSREGVQRDLLPLVEGTTVKTKHGLVKTDHVLFIAAGAFHVSRPSDLIPELQGRFPIRVELDALAEADFLRILTEPEHSLPRQAQALLGTEGIEVVFADDGLAEIARAAAEVNRNLENIGARRLHTILEKVLEEISFAGPDAAGARIVVDRAYVDRSLAELVRDRDLSRFVL